MLVLAAAIASIPLQAGSEIEQHLRDEYKDKVFVIRDFPQGAQLSYDSEGKSLSPADPGDWTVAGFVRVTGVDVSGQRITIKAERLYLGVAGGMGFQLAQLNIKDDKKGKDARKLRIEVAVDPSSITDEKADAVLSKVFLTSEDRFADVVPDYWKPCVRAASTGREAKGLVDCRFAPEFAAVPGVVYRAEENAQEQDKDEPFLHGEVLHELRRGSGITPPKAISQQNPPFSEEARVAKYQGIVTLDLIVDKTGQPRRIRIMRPVGMGLDRLAAEAVAKWRFNPAMKDDQAVAIGPMAVEVSFHLY